MRKLLRRKSVTDLQAEAHSDQRLHRALGPLNLTALGIGAIIGAGIFVLTGNAAAENLPIPHLGSKFLIDRNRHVV